MAKDVRYERKEQRENQAASVVHGWGSLRIGGAFDLESFGRAFEMTDDTAIYQNLSEIHVNKERAPNFDWDILVFPSWRTLSRQASEQPGSLGGRALSRSAAFEGP